MSAPLYGLVLSGGRSTRMQQDKAALRYHGVSQLEHACRSLAPLVDKVFISVREDQRSDPLRQGWPQIVDPPEVAGPIAGIVAAQRAHPEAAWWVLACDLPFLDEATLRTLAAHRQPERPATAFRSSSDLLPEPLCAIYEPQSAAPMAAYIAAGHNCPRKFLLQTDAALLAAANPRALDNVNHPQESATAMSQLAATGANKSIQLRVQYFALLRDQAGKREEALQTSSTTASDLYQSLQQRYAFTLQPEQLRVAINAEFAEWSQVLSDGDDVVFIPPVAGG